MLKKLKTLLIVPSDELDLVSEQFRVFVKQVPVLYLIVATNLLAIISAFAPFGHLGLTVVTPGVLVLFCIARGWTWWRRGLSEVPAARALMMMRGTARLAAALALALSLWASVIFPYGDPAAKERLIFHLALTMIGCTFCLTQLPQAAMRVVMIGIGPFCAYFSLIDDGRFRALALNLTLVEIGVTATILRNAADFVSLVRSQRALLATHEETLRLNDENLRLANLDALTGLANRRAFILKLNALSDGTSAAALEVAMVFVDLDGFKDVNDDYGHEVGDLLIADVAKAFAERLPAGALLARLGGDEFAAVIAAPDAEAKMRGFAQAIFERLGHPIAIGARAVSVGASIGVSVASHGKCDAQELLRRADVAMYHVKANGKFGVRVYSPELDAERRRQAALSDEIRTGLARGEFDVFYQPVIDARSKAIVAVEALLRWPRRPGGALNPAVFVAAAEAGGLVGALGSLALRRACEDFAPFPDIAVNINVGPAQFGHPEFEGLVAAVLSETGFPAQRLVLEVTEGDLLGNPRRTSAAIAALKTLGVRVALDDFAADNASIPFLARCGFTSIKIDRTLSEKIGNDDKACALLTALVHVANGFHMHVTAKGVETEEQAKFLRLAGCESLQGFRYHTPKPIAELRANELRRAADIAAVA